MRRGSVKGRPRPANPTGEVPVSQPVQPTAYKRTKADETDGRPSYRAANGQLCWSVTQIIGKAADPEPLILWAHRQGWQRISLHKARDAARIGTAVHEVVRAMAEDRIPCHYHDWSSPADMGHEAWEKFHRLDAEGQEQARNAIDAFRAWWPTSGYRAVATEVQLIHDRLMLGGSLDVLLEDTRTGELVPVIGDWKTSRNVYAEMIAQVAAYRLMLRDGRLNAGQTAGEDFRKMCSHLGMDVRRGLIVKLPKKDAPIAEVHELTADDLALGEKQFMGAYEVVMARLKLNAVLTAHKKVRTSQARAERND
jgi:hypothetical protein